MRKPISVPAPYGGKYDENDLRKEIAHSYSYDSPQLVELYDKILRRLRELESENIRLKKSLKNKVS